MTSQIRVRLKPELLEYLESCAKFHKVDRNKVLMKVINEHQSFSRLDKQVVEIREELAALRTVMEAVLEAMVSLSVTEVDDKESTEVLGLHDMDYFEDWDSGLDEMDYDNGTEEL